MATADYIVIALFSLLIFLTGLSFSGTSGKDLKSFFAAGGAVPWWINGLSLFMGFVSAGTFVVWGSIAYTSGWVAVTIQWTMCVAGFLVGLLIAPRWHKTKALTVAEFISVRLGNKTQKVYSYIYLVIMVLMTGVYLYSVSRIMEVSTGISLYLSIAILGFLVIIYTTLGGLWAVVVTDVLQFVILTAAAIIVVPLSLDKIGGISGFLETIPNEEFFNLSNHEYTWSFLIGFGLYNLFYLGGQWGFVQRYTSVSSAKDARKVGWLFSFLYLISPVIWMLPPMVYRALNPDLSGLQDEGAYLMMCKEVLPAGMLGLILVSLIFATTSSVQAVLNISAGVITNDLYKVRFSKASDKQLMFVAKLSTFLFGVLTIGIALLVPAMGGAKEVVLSVAALTGCPMYLPLIWSLFSKKQNGFSVLVTTIISLAITLSFKFLMPMLTGGTLSREEEMILGVTVPAAIILIFEIGLRWRKKAGDEFVMFHGASEEQMIRIQNTSVKDDQENKKGLRMIALGIVITGLIIGILGLFAPNEKVYALGMSFLLLLIGFSIFYKTLK
ncbi:MAG: sodium:solute symporter family protein [Mangrovibacterium sp.]